MSFELYLYVSEKNIRKFYPLLFISLLWFLSPPEGLSVQGYRIFIVFLSVIFSLLLQQISMALSVLGGLIFSTVSGLIPIKVALKGYGDSTTWLVVNAFLIAGVIIQTGLGKRISLLCIFYLGKTMSGLGYALCCAELILGPVVPSNTARGGGILAPIVDSISRALGSTPLDKPEKAGAYLHLIGAHANLITAAMFLTGMAANPIVSKAAYDIFEIEYSWLDWALGAMVPGLVGLALLPVFMMYLAPPKISSIKPVREKIKQDLKKIGAWTFHEKSTTAVMVMMVLLWLTKNLHGIGTTTVTFLGIIFILFSGAASWESMIKNHKAWDALIWLGGLLTLATSLKDLGFISWFTNCLQNMLTDFTPLMIFILIVIIYFYSMYLFSMLTAHIVALASAMMLVASEINFAPLVTISCIAYFSNLSGCLTNYSTGPIIIYFGNGYLSTLKWFKVGFLVSLYHLTIWLGIGSVWWRILGWW